MLLFCFPLPSIITISPAALAALPGRGRAVAATSALQHRGSVCTQKKHSGQQGGKSTPKILLGFVAGTLKSLHGVTFLACHSPLSVNIHLCKTNQPNQQQDKSSRRALVLQVMGAGQ